MTEWKAKRFWTEAQVAEVEGGWEVRLDGRPVRTPGKQPLVLPTLALAEAIAAEWDAQEGVIDPLSMPCTRTANSAIEKVAPQKAEVAALLAAYGESDLLCYRAEGPAALIERQAAAWDPLLDWARTVLGAPLVPTAGIVHVAQPADSLSRLAARVAALGPFELAAFHDLVALSGSLVIALAVLDGHAPPEALWDVSRIDEMWQEEQWGTDEEAAEAAARRRGDFLQAKTFLDLVARIS